MRYRTDFDSPKYHLGRYARWTGSKRTPNTAANTGGEQYPQTAGTFGVKSGPVVIVTAAPVSLLRTHFPVCTSRSSVPVNNGLCVKREWDLSHKHVSL